MYSFEDNGDYIYDVQWSPIHPALFATVDGMGKLDLWNLNTDTEVIICVIYCTFIDASYPLDQLSGLCDVILCGFPVVVTSCSLSVCPDGRL